MKNLKSVSLEEQKEFLNSFDQILCDLDGVVWYISKEIPGSSDCIKTLRKIDKKLAFVTNNSIFSRKILLGNLQAAGIEASEEELVNPSEAYIAYLKKHNFDKEIFVLSTKHLKKELQDAGFKLADMGPAEIEESVIALKSELVPNENVGAVIIDIDINVNYVKLLKALVHLKRQDVLYITGGSDKKLPISQNMSLLGTYYIHLMLNEYSGRKPCVLGKPSPDYNKFVVEKLKIEDPSRVLFIGDSVNDDMGFATIGGYKKLLVLSGSTKAEDLIDWKFNEEFRPEYYVEDLKTLNEIILSFN